MDVQNEIRLIRSPLLFMASLFIGFLVEEYVACQLNAKYAKEVAIWTRMVSQRNYCI